MRKGTIGFALAVLLTSLVPTVLARRSASVPILEFRTMVGVFDPFLGSANGIQGRQRRRGSLEDWREARRD